MKSLKITLLLLLSLSFYVLKAQSVTVSGVVYDQDNMAMPAVNVVEKGTVNGTISDADTTFLNDNESVLDNVLLTKIT